MVSDKKIVTELPKVSFSSRAEVCEVLTKTLPNFASASITVGWSVRGLAACQRTFEVLKFKV